LRALQGEAISGVEILRPGAMPGDPDRTILVSYQPAWDEAEEVIGISLSVLDITEQIRLGEIARENASDIVETGRAVPWSMDRNGLNLHLDARWRNVPESERKGLHKLAWLDALHPDDLRAATMAIKVALRTGAPIDMEYRVRDADQQWRWMRSRGSARIGTDGEITRWFGSVVDIHERKQLEEVLLKSKPPSASAFDAATPAPL